MPPVRKIDKLPREVRDELDARASAAGWGNIQGLADWLLAEGYQVSKSAVGVHVKELREQFEAAMADVRMTAELARLMAREDPDQQAVIADASTRIVQDSLLRAALQLRQDGMDPAEMAPLLSQIARAVADVSRVTIAQRRHSDAVRKQAEAEARAAAEAAAKAAGIDDETAGRIGAAIRIYLPDNQRTGAGA